MEKNINLSHLKKVVQFFVLRFSVIAQSHMHPVIKVPLSQFV